MTNYDMELVDVIDMEGRSGLAESTTDPSSWRRDPGPLGPGEPPQVGHGRLAHLSSDLG